MINWSIDEQKFKKEHPKEYRIWRLTQLINYGLDGEKLATKEVIKFWPLINDKIDVPTQVYLSFLLWGKRPSSMRINKNF